MKNKPVQEKHYGVRVWVNKTTDDMRKDEGLCHNCALYKPNHDDNCEIAAHLFEDEVICNIGLMVTRCAEWKER